jgi:pSer/pThr/pTyr-binding forkhead associated (FHA) protein
MRLVLKRSGQTVKTFEFRKGPVHIGRHSDSEVFLPDKVVSRHHAVIYNRQNGTWIIEDLESTNKTYLNEKAIHKAEIKDGDKLRIMDFILEIDLGGKQEDKNVDEISLDETMSKSVNPPDDTLAKKVHNMEDTLSKTGYDIRNQGAKPITGPQIIVRRVDIESAPDIKMPARRINDYLDATEQICRVNGVDEILTALLGIIAKQFSGFHVWCALRNQNVGPMVCNGGKRRDGRGLQLSELKLGDKVTTAIEENQFLLIPSIPVQIGEERIKSAMIAPIIGSAGCFGVIYVDNSMSHESYSMDDIDYLMLVSMHLAAILKNF